MHQRISLGIGLIVGLVALAGCGKGEASPTSGEAPKEGAASGSTAAAGVDASNPSGVVVEWTGKLVDREGEKQVPVYRITNKRSDKKLFFLQAWYYFYDKDKKQIGRRFFERYSLQTAPTASEEQPLGKGIAEMATGNVQFIEVVVVGANFADNVQYRGSASTLAPEQRAYGGGGSPRAGAAPADTAAAAPTAATSDPPAATQATAPGKAAPPPAAKKPAGKGRR